MIYLHIQQLQNKMRIDVELSLCLLIDVSPVSPAFSSVFDLLQLLREDLLSAALCSAAGLVSLHI